MGEKGPHRGEVQGVCRGLCQEGFSKSEGVWGWGKVSEGLAEGVKRHKVIFREVLDVLRHLSTQ